MLIILYRARETIKGMRGRENPTQTMIKDSDVYDLLLKIPAGKVSTYGDLAKALGRPSASREIGRILGRNPNPVMVSCHRVVLSDGKVGGYANGSNKKIKLLEEEGITISGKIISDFKKVRVYPQKNNKNAALTS